MQQVDIFNEYGESFHQDINYKDKNDEGVIQILFKKDPLYIYGHLPFFLQQGYKLTQKDRVTMRDLCERNVYKKYATLSRLAFNLYQQGRPDLIMILFTSENIFIQSIYAIESLISNKPAYFEYKTNVWLCIANNAITHYKDYWIFIEAALRKYEKWEELYSTSSFKTKYDALDKNTILLWNDQKQYETLCLLYPQLKVPNVHFEKKPEEMSSYDLANTFFVKSSLSDTLTTLSIDIEKQRPVWGHYNIAGKTAEEKVYTLWDTLPHEIFFGALLYLSNSKSSYIILNQLKEHKRDEVKDILYHSEIDYKLKIGLEIGRIYNPNFLLSLWELGYRFQTLQEWNKQGGRTSAEQIKLYCLDRLYGNNASIDLEELMNSIIIRVICMIEAIKNNHLFFTTSTWKSCINSIRGTSKTHPLNEYWGYIDMALDSYKSADGQSMRRYLSRKEPGIKLEKNNEAIAMGSSLYKALTILYPEVYN